MSASFWRKVFVVLFVVVTVLTLTPNPDNTKAGFAITRWIAKFFLGHEELGDKVAHFLAYAALAGAAVMARLQFFGRLIFTVLALGVYGAALEGLQAFGGVRDPEAVDAMANAIGALAAYPAALLLRRIVEPTARP